MKSLEEYLKDYYRLEITEDNEDGGYVAIYPDLPGCLTYGDTLEEVISNALDAKKLWIETAYKEGIPIPASSDCFGSVAN